MTRVIDIAQAISLMSADAFKHWINRVAYAWEIDEIEVLGTEPFYSAFKLRHQASGDNEIPVGKPIATPVLYREFVLQLVRSQHPEGVTTKQLHTAWLRTYPSLPLPSKNLRSSIHHRLRKAGLLKTTGRSKWTIYYASQSAIRKSEASVGAASRKRRKGKRRATQSLSSEKRIALSIDAYSILRKDFGTSRSELHRQLLSTKDGRWKGITGPQITTMIMPLLSTAGAVFKLGRGGMNVRWYAKDCPNLKESITIADELHKQREHQRYLQRKALKNS